MILSLDFYQQEDVVSIAQALLGKVLVTSFETKTAGIICEVEGYSYKEKACHAYQNRKTKRNANMFEEGGITYVYLCYGLYPLLNIVTHKKGIAEAILIRGLIPLEGIEVMQKRRQFKKDLANGPGKLTQALAIDLSCNGIFLNSSSIWIEDQGINIDKNNIKSSKRIGIDYAGDDKNLLWRHYIEKL
jgi:DNA-3-methyladenine glycosylase